MSIDVQILLKKHQAFKDGLSRLGTKEYADYMNTKLPRCCAWRELREAGLDEKKLKTLGSTTYMFLLETISAIERGELAARVPVNHILPKVAAK